MQWFFDLSENEFGFTMHSVGYQLLTQVRVGSTKDELLLELRKPTPSALILLPRLFRTIIPAKYIIIAGFPPNKSLTISTYQHDFGKNSWILFQ